MRAAMPKGRLFFVGLAACLLVAGGPKKPYQNVNREIVIGAYWDDASPAANILGGARTHEREDGERFESRSYTRTTGADLATALMAPDMKLFTLLREHRTFSVGATSVDMDMDALRRFILGAKTNPELVEVLVFDAGFIVFAMGRDGGFMDVIVPVDPAIGAEVVATVKGVKE